MGDIQEILYPLLRSTELGLSRACAHRSLAFLKAIGTNSTRVETPNLSKILNRQVPNDSGHSALGLPVAFLGPDESASCSLAKSPSCR